MLAACGLWATAASRPVAAGNEDRTHFSNVFNANRPYRVHYPADYHTSGKRYPVIYFFHGHSGTYRSDPNSNVDYEKIADFVAPAGVLFVNWHGRMPDEGVRPYNIGRHSDVRWNIQMKDYLLELIEHVDATYRTIPDRESRATWGFSMGGFMSFLLAGKYPHLIGTAVDVVGSPNFFVGTPDNHTLYHVKDWFGNHHGVRLRLHNSTTGNLAPLNEEVHQGASREAGLDYLYRVYPGGHKLDNPGETQVFEEILAWILDSFADPLPAPERWHHCDMSPDFDVWGYAVGSSFNEPGVVCLEGVTAGGLGVRTRKWLPDGRPIPGVTIDVTTGPRYAPDTAYSLFDYNVTQASATSGQVTSDGQGRVRFSVNHEHHEIGVFRAGDPPELVVVGYQVDGRSKFLRGGETGTLTLAVLNRGASEARGVTATLSTVAAGVTIEQQTIAVGDVPTGQVVVTPAGAPIGVAPGAPFRVRIDVRLMDGVRSWKDEVDALVFQQASPFGNVTVLDGEITNSDGTFLGRGNDNGLAEPGDGFMLHQDGYRLRLFTDDPYVDEVNLHDEELPVAWMGDLYALTSVMKVRVDPESPPGHAVRFLAKYETSPFSPFARVEHWGTVDLPIARLLPGEAAFVASDAGTQGNWKGTYGSDGYAIVGDVIRYPPYAPSRVTGHETNTWTGSTGDVRALGREAGGRVAACWFSSSSFTVELRLSDARHRIAVYCLDWDQQGGGRAQTIEVRDVQTDALLDSRPLSDFSQGEYLVWEMAGSVKVRLINNNPSTNAVVSGLFFDPVGPPTRPDAPSGLRVK